MISIKLRIYTFLTIFSFVFGCGNAEYNVGSSVSENKATQTSRAYEFIALNLSSFEDALNTIGFSSNTNLMKEIADDAKPIVLEYINKNQSIDVPSLDKIVSEIMINLFNKRGIDIVVAVKKSAKIKAKRAETKTTETIPQEDIKEEDIKEEDIKEEDIKEEDIKEEDIKEEEIKLISKDHLISIFKSIISKESNIKILQVLSDSFDDTLNQVYKSLHNDKTDVSNLTERDLYNKVLNLIISIYDISYYELSKADIVMFEHLHQYALKFDHEKLIYLFELQKDSKEGVINDDLKSIIQSIQSFFKENEINMFKLSDEECLEYIHKYFNR